MKKLILVLVVAAGGTLLHVPESQAGVRVGVGVGVCGPRVAVGVGLPVRIAAPVVYVPRYYAPQRVVYATRPRRVYVGGPVVYRGRVCR